MMHVVPAAEVLAISVRRGSRDILTDVSLRILPGEHVVLIGPNGAGKSTLLQTMAGETPVSSGAVLMAGRAIAGISTVDRARLRAVFAQSMLPRTDFLARDVVAMGRRVLPAAARSDDRAAVARAMRITESVHLANRKCNTLSEGELARVSIARVLVQEAPLLLLDEPVANLDVRHQHMIMHWLGMLARSGAAVLSIVHDINLAYRYADRIALMQDGRLIACDAPEQIADEALLRDVFDFPLRIVRDGPSGVPIIVPMLDVAGMPTVFGE